MTAWFLWAYQVPYALASEGPDGSASQRPAITLEQRNVLKQKLPKPVSRMQGVDRSGERGGKTRRGEEEIGRGGGSVDRLVPSEGSGL